MATQEMHRNPGTRDNPPTEGDRYARESNTWRRMRPWQIWAAAIGAIVLVVGGLAVLN